MARGRAVKPRFALPGIQRRQVSDPLFRGKKTNLNQASGSLRLLAAAAAALALAPAAAADTRADYASAVSQILAQPYQPNYLPLGEDSAFAPVTVANTAPAEDYTSGSIQGSADAPAWPAWFSPVTLSSADGAPLLGYAAVHPGTHPGIVVAHGFNTHARDSVIRWAAMLYASGYDVAAVDQRDFAAEFQANVGYPVWRQTFGWKEAQDVLATGQWLKSRPGVSSVGVVGFSEGAQNAVLALSVDSHHVFSAGLQFSGPADQDTQLYAAPPPVTDALIALVVPPYDYTDPCTVLDDASALYGTTPFSILAQESAYRAQLDVRVPLLGFYAEDDPLVPAFEASMMAGYEAGNPVQSTYVLQRGNHAYFYDRWWQQRAILLYFKALLSGAANDPTVTTASTVNETAGGTPASQQLVDLGSPTRASADAQAAPFVCDTSQPPPAFSAP